MTSPLTSPGLLFDFPTASSVVFFMDSDTPLQSVLSTLTRGARWRTEAVPSISALLGRPRAFAPSCLVLDVSQLDSVDFLPRLWAIEMPVICVTDVGDVALSVRAMKAGAVDVLTKPVSSAPLLEAVRQALNLSELGLRRQVELNEMRRRYGSLSRREREVMALVASGLINKHVARELGISEVTVKAHRGRVMRKMKTESFANLVMIAARLQLTQCELPTPSALHAPLSKRRPETPSARRPGLPADTGYPP
jgi:FixJ family two-component response regulator